MSTPHLILLCIWIFGWGLMTGRNVTLADWACTPRGELWIFFCVLIMGILWPLPFFDAVYFAGRRRWR